MWYISANVYAYTYTYIHSYVAYLAIIDKRERPHHTDTLHGAGGAGQQALLRAPKLAFHYHELQIDLSAPAPFYFRLVLETSCAGNAPRPTWTHPVPHFPLYTPLSHTYIHTYLSYIYAHLYILPRHRRQARAPPARARVARLSTGRLIRTYIRTFMYIHVVAPPSSVVKCLWEVFVWGFGVLFLSCVCVCVGVGGCCSLSVCVCMCVTCWSSG